MCCEGLIDKLPQVDTCCCCCKVETGSKVIAWIGTLGSLYALITTSIGLVGLIAVLSQMKGDDPGKHDKEAVAVAIAILVVLLLYMIIFFFVAFLLLTGLYKENMEKVKLWLRINICLFLFGVVGRIFQIYSVSTAANGADIAGFVVATIIQLLLSLYMLCVVKSHYYNKTQGFQSVSA